MNNIVLQIPMSASLRTQSLSVAQDMGFSSLQELVRVFLTNVSKNQIVFSIADTTALSEKSEKEYLRMSKDFDIKTNIRTAYSINDLMRQLNEN